MRGDHRAVGDQPPYLGFDLAMVHGAYSYPNSGPATANGSSRGMRGGAAEAHALERPLDGPAGAGQAVEEFRLANDGIDQQRSALGSRRWLDQRQRLIRVVGKQRADMPRRAAVADQRHRACRSTPGASRDARQIRRAAASRSKPMARRSRAANSSRSQVSKRRRRLASVGILPAAAAAIAASA